MSITHDHIYSILRESYFFRFLEDSQLRELLKKTEAVQFEEGKKVYEQEAHASNLYIVLNGKVAMEYDFEGGVDRINVLGPNSFFGFELLDDEPYRLTSAIVVETTVLLCIKSDILKGLLEKKPEMEPAFNIALSSLNLLIKKPLSWRQSNETIHYISRQHPFILIARLLTPILGGFALLLLTSILYFTEIIASNVVYPIGGAITAIAAGWSVWNAVDWSNDFYVLTDKRVIFLEKIVLLYESRRETPLDAMLSITKQTDLFGRNFSYGDIIMRTYTGLLKFSSLANPDEVLALLEEQRKLARRCQENEDQREIEAVLRRHFELESSDDEQSRILAEEVQTVEPQKSLLSELLDNILQLRREEGESIIYRTHWFVLLRKTILPSLGLIALFISVLAQNAGWFAVLDKDTYFAVVIALGVIMALCWVYALVDWRNDLYIITPEQIIDVNRKPLGLEEKRAAPIKNIQSIEYKRLGFFGLLFNFGTVFIRIGDAEFTFDYVYNPSAVQQELFSRFTKVLREEKDSLSERERYRLAQWMKTYHRMREEKQARGAEETKS
ncbi:MAG TPA: cyclic nucleotide-binding domain-containing protein [Anaerolineae bacterium]|nr:cyclic nucleotide-binding domain-containing protein [Anaerolineae bacterium]